jgi:cysteinyl-tRNA synthetase
MKLYNTLSRQIESLEPLASPKVSVYTCGPTVYDYPHIGNWFTFIRYDLLIRTLTESGYEPNWVMNITDVGHLTSDADEGEDKLAKAAAKEHKTAWDLAGYYSDYFLGALSRLNFTSPWQTPRATDHIAEQIELIKQLEERGYTYKIKDGIYYDTAKFADYGNFARLDLDEQQSGLRIEANPEKHNSSDFALWKFAPEGVKRDMEWDSPWGKGFPGWHIECSAMCYRYLGETIDIHSGGIDHIPVHHTNEIAQSEAVTNKPLAKIWMHTNHILYNDQKISKSLGNGITLEDIAANNLDLRAFRLYVSESHYRSQSKFSWDGLNIAQNRLLKFINFAALRYQLRDDAAVTNLASDKILSCMQDDLNTPQALAEFESLIEQCEQTKVSTGSFSSTLSLVDSLFGLDLEKGTPDINDQAKSLINSREQARKAKDWVLSDRLRTELAGLNIGINDTAEQGQIWYYLTIPRNS